MDKRLRLVRTSNIIAKKRKFYKYFAPFLQKRKDEISVDKNVDGIVDKLWKSGQNDGRAERKRGRNGKTGAVVHKVIHIVEKRKKGYPQTVDKRRTL